MFAVREIQEGQLEEMAELEQVVFRDPWSLRSLEETFAQDQTLILGAWEEERLVGYLILYHVLEEGEIARIASAPGVRRKGVGSHLFSGLEERCKKKGIQRLLLEVREGNEPARCFYRRPGFREDGKRRGFYREPAEDAVLMSKDLPVRSAPDHNGK